MLQIMFAVIYLYYLGTARRFNLAIQYSGIII